MAENNEIYKAMAGVLEDIEAIGKTQKNIKQNFFFRGIDNILNEIHPIFAKHKIFITSKIVDIKTDERKSQNDNVIICRVLKIVFNFFCWDGSSISTEVLGEAMDTGDKGISKSMSVALKTALIQTFTIPVQDLEDPDSDSYKIVDKLDGTIKDNDKITTDKYTITGKLTEVYKSSKSNLFCAIIDTDRYTTFSETLAKKAQIMMGKNVKATIHKKDNYNNLVDIEEVINE